MTNKKRKFTRASGLSIAQISHISKAEHCVCCGEIVPEGRMVCPTCESKAVRR